MKKVSPLYVLFFTIFIDLLGFGIIIPILPLISTELHATPVEIGFIAGIYSLMNFFFAPFWGTLSDKIGRRPVMLLSIFVTMLAYLFFAFTHNLPLLIISRIFAGIGSANISAAQAYIADITPPELRAKNMGLIGAAFGLGFIFGPPVGAYLKSISGNGSVEWVGYVSAMLCAINLTMAYFILPESLKIKQPDKAFRFRPISDLMRELKKPIIRELFVFNFIYIAAFAMMQITSTLMWQTRYGLHETSIGWVFMFIGVLSAVIQGGLVGRLNKRFTEKQLLLYGSILMACGLATLPIAPIGMFWCELLSLTLISFGNGFITPAVSALISKSVGPTEQGQALGTNQSFGSLARVAGPALGGLFYNVQYAMPFLAGGALMMICLWIASILPKKAV